MASPQVSTSPSGFPEGACCCCILNRRGSTEVSISRHRSGICCWPAWCLPCVFTTGNHVEYQCVSAGGYVVMLGNRFAVSVAAQVVAASIMQRQILQRGRTAQAARCKAFLQVFPAKNDPIDHSVLPGASPRIEVGDTQDNDSAITDRQTEDFSEEDSPHSAIVNRPNQVKMNLQRFLHTPIQLCSSENKPKQQRGLADI